jgi:RHS repeat-associated protein
MDIPSGTRVSPVNNYLYNGKELQENLGLLDYGFRFYDPVVARWNTTDPLAENHFDTNPYNYALNNPVRYMDRMGLDTTVNDGDNWQANPEHNGMSLPGVTITGQPIQGSYGGYGEFWGWNWFANSGFGGFGGGFGSMASSVLPPTLSSSSGLFTQLSNRGANLTRYLSSLDWKGIGDASIGMLGGAGEIAAGSAAEVGSEGLSTAVSVPLVIDGWGRVGTNFNRLAAYFGGNKALGDALPSNIGGYVGKTLDIFTGVDLYSVGKGQATLGLTNDLLLIISPWGNASAWKSIMELPNLQNTIGLGVSYYGGIIGLKNDVQSLPKR